MVRSKVSTTPLTVARVIEICERRMQLTLYCGGGLGGLGLFGASDATGMFSGAPELLKPLFVTLALIAGGNLAFAYAGYDWNATELKRDVADDKKVMTRVLPGWKPPRRAEFHYRIATILIMIAGLCLVIAVWWTMIVALWAHLHRFVATIHCQS